MVMQPAECRKAAPSRGPLAGAFAAVLAAVLAMGCGPESVRHRIEGKAFGTFYQVTWIDGASERVVQEVVDAEIAFGNQLFNAWSPDSVLSALNAHESTEPFSVPPEFAEVLRLALEIAERSGGAYDPTVGPLLSVYGFGPHPIAGKPTPEQVAAARALVDWKLVTLEGDDAGGFAVRKLQPGVRLSLSSVSKGWIVDRFFRALSRLGAPDHFVNIGGEIYASGRKPDGAWAVGIERPVRAGGSGTEDVRASAPSQRPVEVRMELRDAALATSGTYRNYIEAGGRHHIVDPRTGENPTHRFASVSVLGATCALADGLATALLVTGFQDGLDLLDAYPGASALFLEVAADGAVLERKVNWPDE